jgi:2',3'-cyclic-nucleotide 2'-phosphodiesterase (5'-nucleotidase family)
MIKGGFVSKLISGRKLCTPGIVAPDKPLIGRRALVKLIIVLLLTWMVSIGAYCASLTILYTNDIHNRLGSLDSLGQLISRERTNLNPVLLFDCGDAWHDFRVPIYAVWGSTEMLDWMNGAGYDAMAIGNHDLYYGPERLAKLSLKADFPLLCANLVPLQEMRVPFSPYKIIALGNLRVLVIGVITSELLCYPDYPWLKYIDPARAIETVLGELSAVVDLVVVLGHLSVDEAVRIASRVPEIDVFLTGHSHEVTPEPMRQGRTIIVQAGSFGNYLGRLELDIDPLSGRVLTAENSLVETYKAPVMLNRGLLRLFSVLVLIGISLFVIAS